MTNQRAFIRQYRENILSQVEKQFKQRKNDLDEWVKKAENGVNASNYAFEVFTHSEEFAKRTPRIMVDDILDLHFALMQVSRTAYIALAVGRNLIYEANRIVVQFLLADFDWYIRTIRPTRKQLDQAIKQLNQRIERVQRQKVKVGDNFSKSLRRTVRAWATDQEELRQLRLRHR